MADIEQYPSLCSSTDGINVNELGDMSETDMSRNPSVSDSSVLASFSNSNSARNDISTVDVGPLTTTVDGVLLNNVEGANYLSQETSQTNNIMGPFPSSEFEINNANGVNESHTSFGSANFFDVPTQTNTVQTNQLYTYEDVNKGDANMTQPPQMKFQAIPLNAVLGKLQTSLTANHAPLKILTQGNAMASVQSFSKEQLNQLMRLVQQQQNMNSLAPNQEILLHDPVTQQKTIFKICYSNQPVGISAPVTQTPHYTASLNQSHNKSEDAFQQKRHQIDSDILMRLDKEHKKKHRPRTRSGRVSKPPQYMVKDYKHIHPVDYDEDYDDSDGGYSDFKLSSGEEENKNSRDNPLSYASLKSKRFPCGYCEKSYIGRGGLNRHYKLNPTHGKPDDEMGNEFGDSFYSSDSVQSGVLASNIGNGDWNSAGTRRARDEVTTLALEVYRNGDAGHQEMDATYRGARRGRRGRPVTFIGEDRRRQKLFEAAKNCSDEDILELFIQRCPTAVSLWEILSLKNSKVYDSSVDSLIAEVSNLHEQISGHLGERLTPLSEEDYQSCEGGCDLSNNNLFEMVDEKLAICLNLPLGKYLVRSENSPHQKVQLNDSIGKSQEKCITNKDLVLPPRKRLRMSDLSVDYLNDGQAGHSELTVDGKDDKMISTDIFGSQFADQQAFSAGKHGKPDVFEALLGQPPLATYHDTKSAVLDGTDDALVSSTSQVNFFPLGEKSACPNSASALTSNLPDSSLQSALVQSIANSTLSEMWPDIAKVPTGVSISNSSSVATLDLSSSLLAVSDLSEVKVEKQEPREILSLESEPNMMASQQAADSYSNAESAGQQEQGVCVMCYPMQDYIQVQENARYVQTPDGLVIVKNPDGSYQIYGELVQNITLEMLEGYFVN